MLSVITPTHNVKFLKEAWESLKKQTYQDFEWVLVPNGGAVIPDEIVSDPRVRVVPLNIIVDNIGSLKNFACSQARGEITLEFDHDDILMPTALEEAFLSFNDPEVVFSYSNCVEFNNDTWAPYIYSDQWGWRYRDFSLNGYHLKEPIAFEPSPQSLGFIYYAPNHFRAWRTSVYKEIGGHDISMKVIDDHDLMCRFYLNGKMHHIDKPLYLYRVHGKNSWLEKNELVQKETYSIYKKYIYQLVEKWCDQNGFQKVNLGSSHGYKPIGWVGVDSRWNEITADLRLRWPFEDNSVGVIVAWDVFSRLPDKIHTMNEAHRVLVPGGWLFLGIPSTDGRGAFQDPSHVSYWNINSMWYFTKRQYRDFVPEITARFQSWRLETIFPSEWHKENNIPYVVADLVALKEGYDRPESHIPGLVEI